MRATIVILFLLAPLARAEVKPRLAGEYRLRAGLGGGLELAGQSCQPSDPDRSRCISANYLEHRLRLSPMVEFMEGLYVSAEADIVDGLALGQRTTGFDGLLDRTYARADGLSLSTFTPRKLLVSWVSPVGRLVLGMMQANWGSGIVANNGAESPEWGENLYGDTALRFLFATQPLAKSMPEDRKDAWTLLLAADLAYKDESASLVDGDRSWQFIFANRIKPQKDWTVGMYAVGRLQTNFDGNEIQALVIDLMNEYVRKLPDDAELRLDAEGAWIRGRTNTVKNNAAPGVDPEGADWLAVDQLGLMGRVRYTRGPVAGELEAGYASGDGNPFDGAATNFAFDRDYNVSLLMFEEVLAWETAAAARRFADPTLTGSPPDGVRRVPTNGSVTNAIYLRPTARWTPLKRLVTSVAVLWARAAEPVLDPYNTFAKGGDPRNFYDAPAGKSYGAEIDVGLKYELFEIDPKAPPKMFMPQVALAAQAGVMFPGDVFAMPDGSNLPTQLGASVRAAVRW